MGLGFRGLGFSLGKFELVLALARQIPQRSGISYFGAIEVLMVVLEQEPIIAGRA